MVALLEILFVLCVRFNRSQCMSVFFLQRYLCLGEIGSPHDSIILNR